jgi:hypothetical protein
MRSKSFIVFNIAHSYTFTQFPAQPNRHISNVLTEIAVCAAWPTLAVWVVILTRQRAPELGPCIGKSDCPYACYKCFFSQCCRMFDFPLSLIIIVYDGNVVELQVCPVRFIVRPMPMSVFLHSMWTSPPTSFATRRMFAAI